MWSQQIGHTRSSDTTIIMRGVHRSPDLIGQIDMLGLRNSGVCVQAFVYFHLSLMARLWCLYGYAFGASKQPKNDRETHQLRLPQVVMRLSM